MLNKSKLYKKYIIIKINSSDHQFQLIQEKNKNIILYIIYTSNYKTKQNYQFLKQVLLTFTFKRKPYKLQENEKQSGTLFSKKKTRKI